MDNKKYKEMMENLLDNFAATAEDMLSLLPDEQIATPEHRMPYNPAVSGNDDMHAFRMTLAAFEEFFEITPHIPYDDDAEELQEMYKTLRKVEKTEDLSILGQYPANTLNRYAHHLGFIKGRLKVTYDMVMCDLDDWCIAPYAALTPEGLRANAFIAYEDARWQRIVSAQAMMDTIEETYRQREGDDPDAQPF